MPGRPGPVKVIDMADKTVFFWAFLGAWWFEAKGMDQKGDQGGCRIPRVGMEWPFQNVGSWLCLQRR